MRGSCQLDAAMITQVAGLGLLARAISSVLGPYTDGLIIELSGFAAVM